MTDRPPLSVPARFGNLAMLKFHVEQHHGYWFGDVKTVAEGRRAHAAMHTDPAPPVFGGPVPHIHADVTELTVIRFNNNEGK